MNKTWQSQVSRRKILSDNNPEYYTKWVIANVPAPLWLTPGIVGGAPDSVYEDLSTKLNEMGVNSVIIKEKKEFERNLAVAWNDGYYTDQQAKLSAEIQGLNWGNVTVERSRLYEIEQCANEGYYHGIN